MKFVLTVFKREFSSLLASPAAWVFTIIFLVMCGLFSFVFEDILSVGQADLTPFFNWIPWLYIFVIPALAMPLWAEEKKSGTFDLLMSYPVSIMKLVLGKYFAGLLLLVLALIMTFGIPVTLFALGKPDYGAVVCGYFGAFCIGSVFLAASCFCSALSKNYTESYLLALALCAALVFSGWNHVTEVLQNHLNPLICRWITYCAVIPHYQSFQRGIIDSGEIFYCVMMTALFIYWTNAQLQYAASGSGNIFSTGTIKDAYTWQKIGKTVKRFVIALYVFVCLTYFTGTFRFQFDFTEDKAYSLSPLSECVASDLKNKIEIRLYVSSSGFGTKKEYRLYADRVAWLLRRFADASNGMASFQMITPEQDTFDEEIALSEGIRLVQNPEGDRFFLGMSVSCGANTVSLPFLSPKQENMLEYEFIRAVERAASPELKTIGVLSAFPVLGRKADPVKGIQPAACWYCFEEAGKDFRFVEIPLDVQEIPAEIDALVVFHPAGITSRTCYALDQYLLSGKNLCVFVDPDSAYARANIGRSYNMIQCQTSTLEPLLKAWGVNYNTDKLAADMNFKLDRLAANGIRQVIPTVLNVDARGFNRDIPWMKYLSSVRLNFSGVFFLTQRIPGLQYDELMFTTEKSSAVSAGESPESIFARFNSDEKAEDISGSIPLAWHIYGSFQSAFPNGKADVFSSGSERKHLAKSKSDAHVFLIGDSDMLFHDACMRSAVDDFNQQNAMRINDNLTFFQNILDEQTESVQLAELRNRIPSSRPLTKVNERKLRADLKFKDQILKLGANFNRLQKQVDILNRYRAATGGQQQLTKEQQDILSSYEEKRQDFIRSCKVIRGQLKEELDSLNYSVRMINIVYIPLFVALAGIIWAFRRRLPHRREK